MALLLVWSADNGGYDPGTWYWGALVLLALTGVVAVASAGRLRLARDRLVALTLFGLYVAWCYASIAWAQSQGDALQGANQALLYFLIFALMLGLPWTPRAALLTAVCFTFGLGVIAAVLMFRLASPDRVSSLIVEGRLAAPTGYFNSTAALFTIGWLLACVLGQRRELPGPIRGLLVAFACCELQLAVVVQSRGWLFTLPLVALAALWATVDRLRVAAFGLIPLAATLVVLHRLLGVYERAGGGAVALGHAAARAGRPSLVACACAFLLVTLLSWLERLRPPPTLSPAARRTMGLVAGGLAVVAFAAAGTYATHGHPLSFVTRQWNGFSHVQASFSATSHFGDVGSDRYDFWRSSLGAFVAHPIGGLGEDNFGDYYLLHRHTAAEPSWTHSLEMRLLAQTGLVGFLLFVAFLACTLRLAVRARRRAEPTLARAMAGAALLPLTVWLIHGSLDWFWEMPALSGPALAFLGMVGSLAPRASPALGGSVPLVHGRGRVPRRLAAALAYVVPALAFAAATVVLGLPFLAQREMTIASRIAGRAPAAALSDLSLAANLNPLSSVPGRLGGVIALQSGEYGQALRRFQQSISREPASWFAWLGAGLAASALGDRGEARRDFVVAHRIDATQPVTAQALAQVDTRHPLTWVAAEELLVVVS